MKVRITALCSLLTAVVLAGSVSLCFAQSSNANGRVVTDNFDGGARTCGTPTPTSEEMQSVQSQVDRWLRTYGQTNAVGGQIKVAFHVIYGRNNEGNIPQSQVTAQIATLNSTYAGTGYTFVLASTDRTFNAQWFTMTPQTNKETQAKNALAISPATRLNFYTCKPGQNLLGWAYFPNSFPESDKRHGVVVHYASVPGGAFAAYNEGETGTHEVGHYLGLYHTFQGGCTAPGDFVDDTPYEASAYTGNACSTVRNTCPSAGNDPISNYMDYSYDVCLTNFTAGQDVRMDSIVPVYRPNLLNAAAMAPELASSRNDLIDIAAVSFAGAVPNPSRGSADLVFSLPKSSRVSLALYSVSGRRIADVLDETRDAGSHTVRLERQDIGAGTYFALLKVDGVKYTRTVILN